MTTKTCFKCGETKDLNDFYRHAMMADGHLGKCKECTKRDSKARYYNKHDEVMAYEHGRLEDPRRIARVKRYAAYLVATDPGRLREYVRRSIAKYPEKRRARTAVGNALRDGKLVRKPCEVCGKVNAQAHHPDYSKPLEVVWLCSYHHGVAHRDSKYRHREEAA